MVIADSLERPEKLIDSALVIIDSVKGAQNRVYINCAQCKRLAGRFEHFGGSLRKWQRTQITGNTAQEGLESRNILALAIFLKILERGQELVLSYTRKHWLITRLLTRADNRETFDSLHKELDHYEAYFGMDASECMTEEERVGHLVTDAEQDRAEMRDKLIQELGDVEDVACSEHLQAKLKLAVQEKLQESDKEFPSYLQIDPATIKLENLLGRGPFGPVYKGDWLGCPVAVKVIQLSQGNPVNDVSAAELCKQVGPLFALRHPHIAQELGFALLSTTEDSSESTCYIVLEWMHGDIRTIMEKRSTVNGKSAVPFTAYEAQDIITQIASGMHFLHEQGYRHRDLQPFAVLGNDHGNCIDIRLGTFSASPIMTLLSKQEEFSTPLYTGPILQPWNAPEVWKSRETQVCENGAGTKPEKKHSYRLADVYSFAMTACEILTGQRPFESSSDHQKAQFWLDIDDGLRPDLPVCEGLEGLTSLIRRCWDSDPEKRPTFKEICDELDNLQISPKGTSSKVSHDFRTTHVAPANRVIHPSDDVPNAGNDKEKMVFGSCGSLPKELHIDPASLKRERLVGKGGYAEVHEGSAWPGSCKLAIKTFTADTNVLEMQTEVGVLMKLRHPHIVKLMGYSVGNNSSSIVMELMSSDLRDLIDKRMKDRKEIYSDVPFSHKEAMAIISKIAKGMSFLHRRDLLHRDLKARNVLVNERSADIEVKISDFGVSQYIQDSRLPSGVTGSGYWRAPEVLRAVKEREKIEYTCQIDVYAFGMTCYEILSGKLPCDELSRTSYDVVISGHRPQLPPATSPGLVELITRCWHTDPKARPDFLEICDRLPLLHHQ